MGLMNKSELKEIVRTELSELLSEYNTNAFEDNFIVYKTGVEGMADFIHLFPKDKFFVKIHRAVWELLQKVEKHLDDNYEGWMDEGIKEAKHYKESDANIRATFAELEDAEFALQRIIKDSRGDKQFVLFYKAHKKMVEKLEKHLDKNYPDWEKRVDEAIRNPKKWKANLEKALKKYKKGASVHYFPLSGGNYVMVGPKGVQTKDKEAVDVKIRDVGTYDADNSQQVSVGIELNNGHEATWNGTEFEIDDLGCPLLLGKG